MEYECWIQDNKGCWKLWGARKRRFQLKIFTFNVLKTFFGPSFKKCLLAENFPGPTNL